MNSARHELAIMVVEDHNFQRKALMHQIRGLGYGNLLEAQDGEEALAQCQHHRVDILFCDLRMPGMDGMALLRRLSLGGFRGGIVLCSALPMITSVSGSMSPLCSASGMKRAGEMRPYSGCCQRASASMPSHSPL